MGKSNHSPSTDTIYAPRRPHKYPPDALSLNKPAMNAPPIPVTCGKNKLWTEQTVVTCDNASLLSLPHHHMPWFRADEIFMLIDTDLSHDHSWLTDLSHDHSWLTDLSHDHSWLTDLSPWRLTARLQKDTIVWYSWFVFIFIFILVLLSAMHAQKQLV